MHSQLVSPNLHVVLIHYPLALLIAGTFIETFSFLWRRSSFRTAGRWMILVGALSAVPATFSGIYALRDVARIDSQIRWQDLKATSPRIKPARNLGDAPATTCFTNQSPPPWRCLSSFYGSVPPTAFAERCIFHY